MQTLTSKEFLEQLKTNNLKPAFTLKGIVKKTDNDSEVLFSRKGDFEHWIAIPASMIDSVFVIKTFQKENQTFVVVNLQLKTPSDPEAQVFQKLMAADGHHGMGHCGFGGSDLGEGFEFLKKMFMNKMSECGAGHDVAGDILGLLKRMIMHKMGGHGMNGGHCGGHNFCQHCGCRSHHGSLGGFGGGCHESEHGWKKQCGM